MNDLTDFLLARIAEDERDANAIRDCDWYHGVESDAEAEVQRLSNPARVLAECEAKRRIVDYREAAAHESMVTGLPIFEARLSAYDAALRALALPYADHPDYREDFHE